MVEPTDQEVEQFIDQHPYGGTYDEIAEVLGVTRQRIPQILDSALTKVKRALGARGVRTADDILAPRHFSHRTTDSLFS